MIVPPSRAAASTAMRSPSLCRSCMQSMPQPPSTGTSAALRTMAPTRPPRAATTPGTTRPPEECATSVTGPVGRGRFDVGHHGRHLGVDGQRGQVRRP